jgi:hypothetical protein
MPFASRVTQAGARASSNRDDTPDLIEINRVLPQLCATNQLHLSGAKERRGHTLVAPENDLELDAWRLGRIIPLGDSKGIKVTPLQ